MSNEDTPKKTADETHDQFKKYAEGNFAVLGIVWNEGHVQQQAQHFVSMGQASDADLDADALRVRFMERIGEETVQS